MVTKKKISRSKDMAEKRILQDGPDKVDKRVAVWEIRLSGFTLIEVIMTMVVLAVLAAVAIPGFSVWLPKYRLKAAARDMVSNFQLAKMGAIKNNRVWAVVFDPGVTPGRYFICSDDNGDGWNGPPAMGGNDVVEKTVDLGGYGKGIDFGHGNATNPVGSTFGANDISYTTPDEVAVFSSKGTVSNLGYVYLSNTRDGCWAVGTPSNAGVVVLKRWAGSGWE